MHTVMPRRLLIAILALLTACGTPVDYVTPDAGGADAGVDAGADASTDAAIDAALEGDAGAAPTCEQRIADRGFEAPSAEHDAYVAGLPEVLVHARIDPVLFLRWPDVVERGDEARLTREALASASRPSRALRELVEAHRDNPAFLREVVLSDGYLFAREPRLARALSAEVDLDALFDAPTIFRARDGVVEELVRGEDGYVGVDGRRATLRLNDRVADELDALAQPLGLDLEVVRAQTGALRTIPTGLGADAAAFRLHFPDGTERAGLAELRDGRTEVVCVGGDLDTLEGSLAHARAFAARTARLEEAARTMVRQRVRFDEPVNEPEGVQEDGQLRRAWRRAYFAGQDEYVYRDVAYPVYDREGAARPPQVCIDFVFDSYARALGSFYRGEDARPGREAGELDLEHVPGLPRRSISQLVSYANGEDSIVDRYDVPRRQRVALQEGRAYARAIAGFADEVRAGDVLVIHGLRLQDGNLHYHAVLVLRTEPMTGVPMVVADNQGRPRFRTLAGAMRAAPLRSVKHRLRFEI